MSAVDYLKYLSECHISTGVVRYKDLAYLLCSNDKNVAKGVAHCRMFQRHKEKWGGIELRWNACSAAVIQNPAEKFIVLGSNGEIYVAGGGEAKEEPRILCEKVDPQTRGQMTEIRNICDHAYAVGLNRQVYRRDSPGKWACIDDTAQTGQDPINCGFKSIDGFSEEEMYAVGWGGEIWQFDGGRWIQRVSPTKLALQKIRCSKDGIAYACGQSGILVRGRGEDWTTIDHHLTDQDFWGIETFNDQIYLSTLTTIFSLKDSKLEPVSFGRNPPKTAYHLSSADGILWSIGASDIFEFNGEHWKQIVDITAL